MINASVAFASKRYCGHFELEGAAPPSLRSDPASIKGGRAQPHHLHHCHHHPHCHQCHIIAITIININTLLILRFDPASITSGKGLASLKTQHIPTSGRATQTNICYDV